MRDAFTPKVSAQPGSISRLAAKLALTSEKLHEGWSGWDQVAGKSADGNFQPRNEAHSHKPEEEVALTVMKVLMYL